MNNWIKDGKFRLGVGFEDTFIPQQRLGNRKLDLYELTQHYSHWKMDLKLAEQSGAELIRWGIPWYLTEPEPGKFDFSWIDRIAEEIKVLGLTCVVDLMHYGTPYWLENSFLHPDYPSRVAEYAHKITDRYLGLFHAFTPLNEPMVNAEWCGMKGAWPPYLTGDHGFLAVLLPLILGMRKTTEAIRTTNSDSVIVHVDAGYQWVGDFPGYRSKEFLDEWRFLASDLLMGRVDDHHPLFRFLVSSGVDENLLGNFTDSPQLPDVIGLNYYPAFTRQRYNVAARVSEPVEAGEEGLRQHIDCYYKRYGLPLAITETSRATDSDEEKIRWIDGILATCVAARSESIPLLAAFWFPFLDMFDWEYRFGTAPEREYQMPFGLVDLVRQADNNLLRQPNRAYMHFREIALKLRGEDFPSSGAVRQ